jgi:ATP-dependent Lon protease
MEIIPLAGYTEDEKREIAKQHLIDKQIKNHGLKKEFELTDEALTDIIRYYTREAGVRNLEREIAKLRAQGGDEDRQEARKRPSTVTPDTSRTSSA